MITVRFDFTKWASSVVLGIFTEFKENYLNSTEMLLVQV